jgi:hypothetical protein
MQKAVIRWAKFFGIFYFLGVTVDDFVNEKPDFKHDDLTRYEDDNAHLGTTAELYAIIPAHYMTYMNKHKSIAAEASNPLPLVSHFSLIFTF